MQCKPSGKKPKHFKRGDNSLSPISHTFGCSLFHNSVAIVVKLCLAILFSICESCSAVEKGCTLTSLLMF